MRSDRTTADYGVNYTPETVHGAEGTRRQSAPSARRTVRAETVSVTVTIAADRIHRKWYIHGGNEQTVKEVNDIMGGTVLDYQAKHIHDAGIEQGREEIIKAATRVIVKSCTKDGLSEEEAVREMENELEVPLKTARSLSEGAGLRRNLTQSNRKTVGCAAGTVGVRTTVAVKLSCFAATPIL